VILSADDGCTTPDELAAAALTLAQCFSAGATMWCVSPQWPAHGRHLAVEFVHPVIVGKRALPSVHVDDPDPAGALRLLARPGDVLLAVSTAEDATTIDVLRRAEAWGLTRVWLGAGPRPSLPLAEQVVWAESAEPGRAARSGDVVILYHLLWELTHVVFEHPGLLEGDEVGARPGDRCEAGCITCSDQGDLAEVRATRGDGLADVVVRGRPEVVDISLVEGAAPYDLIVLHAGVAIAGVGESFP